MRGRDQKIFLEALDELEKEKGILKEKVKSTILHVLRFLITIIMAR